MNAHNTFYGSGLSGTVMSYQRNLLTFSDDKGKIPDGLLLLVGERNISKFKAFELTIRQLSVLILGNLLLILQKASQIIDENAVFHDFHHIFKQSDQDPGHCYHQTGHDGQLSQ